MTIGVRRIATEAFSELDLATSLIVPVLEEFIPKELDSDLDLLRRGSWHHDMLDMKRLLRLELLHAAEPSMSYQAILRQIWQVWRLKGLVDQSVPSSSALAQARKRLPDWVLAKLFDHTVRLIDNLPGEAPLSEGRLLSIDGAPLPVPNSKINREHFATTSNHKGQAYFPQAQMVWLADQSTRGILAQRLATSREGDESIGPYMLLETLRPGDLILGDAHYGTYATIASVKRREARFLCRAPGPLKIALHITQRHTNSDMDLVLQRSPQMDRKYADLDLPASISMRVAYLNLPCRDKYNGFQRVPFLTNLAREDYSLERLSELALRRWSHETLNADVKSRLDLSGVRGNSPHTVRHEVMSHLCINNILRLLFVRAMGSASLEASFQTGLEALRGANNQARYSPRGSEITDLLLALIREAPLKKRPNRTEPRMTRPRRRPYPIFKESRADWRARRKGSLEKTAQSK